jgi:Vitamin K-dependent gamma-carboxylase
MAESLSQSAYHYWAHLRTALPNGWAKFWFEPTDPMTLGAIRLCTGLVLLDAYIQCTPRLLDFIGPLGWIDGRAVSELRAAAYRERSWLGASSWFSIQNPLAIWIVHSLFLIAIFCFAIGFLSRMTSILVWIGHVSFVVRAHGAWYGLDSVLAMLTFYLMFGPTGKALAVDVWLEQAANVRSRKGPSLRRQTPVRSWSANLVVRLIQVHMCIIYLCAGLAKLQGETWWNGTAIWCVMMTSDVVPFDLHWLGYLNNLGLALIFETATAATLIIEITFAFLVWNRLLRPLVLLAALLLHLGIGALMGLGAFSAAMLTGCLAFVSPDLIRRAVSCVSTMVNHQISRHVARFR